MARKVIKVKPVTELELQFEDGRSLCVVFDTLAFYYLSELNDGNLGFSADERLPEQCAKIVYAGAKERQPEFTFEEARALVAELNIGTITEIMLEFGDGMESLKDEVQREQQKKLMAIYQEQKMR